MQIRQTTYVKQTEVFPPTGDFPSYKNVVMLRVSTINAINNMNENSRAAVKPSRLRQNEKSLNQKLLVKITQQVFHKYLFL